jgi:hypothetical protein
MKAGQVDNPILIATVLGSAAGLLIAIGSRIAGGFELHVDFVGPWAEIGEALATLVFPLTLSYVAGRRYFLWGFIPPVIALVVNALAMCLFNRPGVVYLLLMHGLLADILVIFAGVLVTAGPVSLIRYILQRRSGGAKAPVDLSSVENVEKEGTWPPPPKR